MLGQFWEDKFSSTILGGIIRRSVLCGQIFRSSSWAGQFCEINFTRSILVGLFLEVNIGSSILGGQFWEVSPWLQRAVQSKTFNEERINISYTHHDQYLFNT